MTIHKVADLERVDLNVAVALAEGHKVDPCLLIPYDLTTDGEVADYATDWSQGGPIIERERITIIDMIADWSAYIGLEMSCGEIEGSKAHASGPTPLIAAMRAFVASKFGETVELP